MPTYSREAVSGVIPVLAWGWSVAEPELDSILQLLHSCIWCQCGGFPLPLSPLSGCPGVLPCPP